MLLSRYINKYLLNRIILLLLLVVVVVVFMPLKWVLGTGSIDVNCITLAQGTFSWRTVVKTTVSSRSHFIK